MPDALELHIRHTLGLFCLCLMFWMCDVLEFEGAVKHTCLHRVH